MFCPTSNLFFCPRSLRTPKLRGIADFLAFSFGLPSSIGFFQSHTNNIDAVSSLLYLANFFLRACALVSSPDWSTSSISSIELCWRKFSLHQIALARVGSRTKERKLTREPARLGKPNQNFLALFAALLVETCKSADRFSYGECAAPIDDAHCFLQHSMTHDD